MAWLSRFVGMIERVVTRLDGSPPLEDEDASGLWMSTADALEAAPETFAAPSAAAPSQALPDDVAEPVSQPRVVQLRTAPPPPAAQAPEIQSEPEATPEEFAEEPAATDELEPAPMDDAAVKGPEDDASTEVANAPAEATSQAAAVEHVAAGSDPADDMLSMFRDSSFSSEHADLTKEIDDITARELLDEARAVLGLLTANRAPREEDAIA